ncbi:MAG TPA: glycosyltransferase N-terminal domain-containing protein [Gemmatimonadaceae bacterium]|nr:glycosyltransferase N-terminal domain-containing protein [Gemmatimonadaceae bacterium]
MHPALRLGYGAAGQLARALAALAPAGGSKLLRALRARRGIRERYRRWGGSGRDPARPLLWLHAPSVGEGLQARPVVELVRRERPDAQVAYTFFSPSAARFAQSLGADFADYLPFDTAGDAAAALDALRPTALVFSKLDVWPSLAAAAADRGVRLGLISATLAAGSSRRGRLAGVMLRDAYALLDAVGAIDADDAARLVELGVRPEAVVVTGDTRYDQVWARAAAADRSSPVLAPLSAGAAWRFTLVAGSTWPADEEALLPAWERLRAAHPSARLIIAPHEPTAAHLRPIEGWAARAGVPLARLGAEGAPAAEVVLVDRVGVLGELYALADAAFVGGGFHAAGLHSVLEPAAFGAPVLFGPRHALSRDAGLLLAAGGGASVPNADALHRALAAWAADPPRRADAGSRARSLVRAGLGAARRSFDLVNGLL